MKVAVIQYSPDFGDVKTSIEQLKYLLKRAKNADLIVLPELCNSGYNFESKEQALSYSETIEESIFLRFLKYACDAYKFAVVSGFLEKEEGELYNSAVFIDSSGVKKVYRKLHLFMNEKNIFEPGNFGLPIVEYKGVKIGMLICFDWMFPEVWRKLALQGVDMILHPSNLVLPYAQSVIPAYAMVNRIFIATANRVGEERDLKFTGQSLIVNPKGEVLAKAGDSKEVLLVDIEPELARDKMITAMNHAFMDRRTDIYE